MNVILKNDPLSKKYFKILDLRIYICLKFDEGVINDEVMTWISKINSRECEIMYFCRKCGKEVKEKQVSYKYHIEHRRGKVSSDKICSECN